MSSTSSTPPHATTTLTTPVWLLDGLRSIAGTLDVTPRTWSFVSRDGRHDVTGPVDDALRVTVPRRSLGAGLMLTASGRRYRFSLTHPEALVDPRGPRERTGNPRSAVTALRRILAPANRTTP